MPLRLIFMGTPDFAVPVLDALVEAGHDPRRFASDLLQRFRDLVLLRVTPEQAARGMVDAPEDQLRTMTAQAEKLGVGSLTRFAEITHNGLVEMRGATAPRLLLELRCAGCCCPPPMTARRSARP